MYHLKYSKKLQSLNLTQMHGLAAWLVVKNKKYSSFIFIFLGWENWIALKRYLSLSTDSFF